MWHHVGSPLHVLVAVDSGETLVSRSCTLDSGDEEDIADDDRGRKCRVVEVDAAEAAEAATAVGNGTVTETDAETVEGAGKNRMLYSCVHKCRDGWHCMVWTVCHLATWQNLALKMMQGG